MVHLIGELELASPADPCCHGELSEKEGPPGEECLETQIGILNVAAMEGVVLDAAFTGAKVIGIGPVATAGGAASFTFLVFTIVWAVLHRKAGLAAFRESIAAKESADGNAIAQSGLWLLGKGEF